MNHWAEALKTILPVMLVVCIGMLCRTKKLITREGIDTLKKVAVNICLPAVLFRAFANTSYGIQDLLIPLAMFGVCALAWYLGRIGARLLRMRSRFIPFLTTGFEAGMLGYALFEMLYGAEQVEQFARIDLGQVLFVFTLYKVLLGLSGGQKADRKALIRDMAASPIIVAILAGVALGATGIYQKDFMRGVSGVLNECAGLVAAPTSVLILLCIGYDLVLRDIPWRETLRAAALRVAVMLPLCCAFLLALRLLYPAHTMHRAIYVMFILPPPFVLPVFADDARQRTFVSAVLSVSTLIAIAGFCALAILRL